jgi:hypothetical protein
VVRAFRTGAFTMAQPNPNEQGETKARKTRVSKTTRTQDAKSKVKIAAYISLESARRLGIHATMTDQDKSTIIDGLIREHLRDWVVQYRPSGGIKPGDDIGTEPEAAIG